MDGSWILEKVVGYDGEEDEMSLFDSQNFTCYVISVFVKIFV
jgi:hypothetical protein